MSLQESEPSLRKSVFCVYKSQNWEFTKAGIQSFKKLESSLQKSKLWVYKSQSRDDKSLNSVFTKVRTVFTKDGILSLKQDSEKKSELWKSKSELKKYFLQWPLSFSILLDKKDCFFYCFIILNCQLLFFPTSTTFCLSLGFFGQSNLFYVPFISFFLFY